MRLILRTLLIGMATVALSASVYGTGGRNHNDGNHNDGNHNDKDDINVCDDHRDTVKVQRSEAAKRFARNNDNNNEDDGNNNQEPGECPESPDK